MNTLLWICQGLLAGMFVMAGMMKLMQPREKMADKMKFAGAVSDGTFKMIGVVEVLGGVGIILPWITGIMPGLTVWAATGLMLEMLVAAITHVRYKEYPYIGVNAVLFAMAALVAYGRSGSVPM